MIHIFLGFRVPEMIDFYVHDECEIKHPSSVTRQRNFRPLISTLTNGMKFLLGTLQSSALLLAPWPILVVTFIPFCQDKPFSHAILCVVVEQQ